MPFLDENTDNDGAVTWTEKSEVGLRQLSRPNRGWRGRTGRINFEILENFGYVDALTETERISLPDNVVKVLYEGPESNRLVCRGETTDLASIPGVLWGVVSSYGDHTMAALLHDKLCTVAEDKPYKEGRALRREADSLFRRMLKREAGVGIATRWMMWSAVRLFATKVVGALAVLLALAVGMLVLDGFDRAPAGPNYLLAVEVLAGLLLLVAIMCSIENEGFRWRALAALAGASLIGILAAIPLIPVILLTLVTWAALRVVDFVLFAVHLALIKFPLWLGERVGISSAGASRTKDRIGHEPVPVQGLLLRRG